MLGFGNSRPKRVTEREFKDITNRLSDLDTTERNQVEILFRPALFDSERGRHEPGISPDEAKLGITWLRDNKDKHSIEDDEIDRLEKYLDEHLID